MQSAPKQRNNNLVCRTEKGKPRIRWFLVFRDNPPRRGGESGDRNGAIIVPQTLNSHICMAVSP